MTLIAPYAFASIALEIIDGGSASSPPSSDIDGGSAFSTASSDIDGGSAYSSSSSSLGYGIPL